MTKAKAKTLQTKHWVIGSIVYVIVSLGLFHHDEAKAAHAAESKPAQTTKADAKDAKKGESKAPAAKPAGPASMPTIVSLAPAESMQWQPIANSVGTLSAYSGAMISAEAPGRVTKIYAHSGDSVKKGTPLIQIFPNVLQAQLKQSEASLKLTKLTYQRNVILAKKGFVSKQALDISHTNLLTAEATLNQVKAQLKQHILKAPFAGKLGIINANVGQYLNIGAPITTIEQYNPLRIDFAIPSRYQRNVSVGTSVTLTSPYFSGDNFNGTITALSSAIDPQTRMLGIRAKVPNNNHLLMPGDFLEVTAVLGKLRSVTVVPQTAIVYSAEHPYVYTVTQMKAQKIVVGLGERLDNNLIIITAGLKPGDTVVTGGQMKLHEGSFAVTREQAQAYFRQQAASHKKK